MGRGPLGRLLAALTFALVALVGLSRSAHADAEGPDVLVVGLTGKYPPFHYFDDAGELTGFDVAFSREICAKIGRRCEFRTLQWDGLIGALLADRIDAVIGSMAITEARKRAVHFTVPYYESGARLFVRPGAGDPHEPGYSIGVTLGTTFEAAVRNRFPEAEVRVFKGDTDILQDLMTGRLDAMVTDDLVGAYMARQRGAVVERWGQRILDEDIGIAIRPGRDDLVAEIDRAITELRESGRQAELLAEHVGEGDGGADRLTWWSALPLLLRGLAATAKVCALGIGLGFVLALLLAWALVSRTLITRPVALLVDFIRSTPFMVQLFALYFGPPSLGVSIDAFTSATLAIALHSSAYLAEVAKTAYAGVPDGQRLASRALGLSRYETLRHVIGPQMLPLLTVPALNTVVAMIKDSAIVSVIGVYELTLQAQQLISTTFRPIEFYAAAAALYFLVTYPLLVAGRRLEARWRREGLLHG